MSYLDLINIKYKTKLRFILLICGLILLVGWLFNKEITSIYKTLGYVDGDKILLNIPIDYLDILEKMEYVKVNDQKYNLEVLDISEVLLDSELLVNYQVVSFKKCQDWLDNQVLNINIFYQKEKVWKKLEKFIWR